MKKLVSGIYGASLLGVALMMGPLAQAAPDASADKGKETFEACGVCHSVDTDEKKIGPSLKGLFQRDKLKNGKKVTEGNVKAVINAGGNGMPSYADTLSDDEKADVLAYLKTL